MKLLCLFSPLWLTVYQPTATTPEGRTPYRDISGTQVELQAEHTTRLSAFPTCPCLWEHTEGHASLPPNRPAKWTTLLNVPALNRIDYIDDHIEQLENQITEVVKAQDDVVDMHEEQAVEICKLQLKVVDLKDRSRHNKGNPWSG